MADVMTPEQRSRCMAAIKGKDTKPELIVRKYLFSRGLRFRVQVRKLPGNPDILLPKYKTVIFVKDASGTAMMVVNISVCRNPMWSFGKRRLNVM